MKTFPKLKSPNPYLARWTKFLECKIFLDSRPMIPRPETEFWTEQFIKFISENFSEKKLRVLDAFAGSGCVGIAVMSKIPHIKVDFAEINPTHVQQIKRNIEINRLGGRDYKIYKTNILENTGAYDFILVNPPYLKKEDLVRGITDFEPKRALIGGKDGLSHIRRLLQEAPEHLCPGGSLWMEFDPSQKKEIHRLAENVGYQKIEFERDQYGKWRYVVIRTRTHLKNRHLTQSEQDFARPGYFRLQAVFFPPRNIPIFLVGRKHLSLENPSGRPKTYF